MADDTILLRVTNSMAPDRATGAEGIGLKNVRERMAVQFEGHASLRASGADSEWISEITMPAIRESPQMIREPPPGDEFRAVTLLDA